MIQNVAIIIPAWKPDFLQRAIQSLLEQRADNYHIYIGDDGSPHDIKGVVDLLPTNGKISYFRFEQNLGGTDLVAHWERCIQLSWEPWVWLFSDDDVASPHCLDNFNSALTKNSSADLFHFPVQIIDEDAKPISPMQAQPIACAREFLSRRVRGEIHSFAIEYIVRRSALAEAGGFSRFDLAWGSDDATWMKLIAERKPVMIDNACVFWRSSRVNISPDTSAGLATRKIHARLSFIVWATNFLKLGKNDAKLIQNIEAWYLRQIHAFTFSLSLKQIIHALLLYSLRMKSVHPSATNALLIGKIFMAKLIKSPERRR